MPRRAAAKSVRMSEIGLLLWAVSFDFEIGRVQLRSAGVVIIEPLVPQRFEIEQVSRVFLDRPFSFVLSREDFGQQSAHRFGQTDRRAP